MTQPLRNQISAYVSKIKLLEIQLKPLARAYADKVRSFPEDKDKDQTIEFWRALSLHDSLTRIRNFIENNFSVIETLGVLSLARYTFEMVVHLKRIELDANFAIVYAREVFEQQIKHYEKLANHLKHEITLYRSLCDEETEKHDAILKSARLAPKQNWDEKLGYKIAEDIKAASDAIDERLATILTLYSDEAKVYGFAFQADCLETQVLQKLISLADQNRESLSEFDGVWKSILDSDPKYNIKKWSKRANQVRMDIEYEFIYSYTSRLLHATPVSLSINQQCLQDDEILMFLKYVYSEFLWLTRYAERSLISKKLQ